MRSLIPKLLIALKHLIQADQVRVFCIHYATYSHKHVLNTQLSTPLITNCSPYSAFLNLFVGCVWQDQASEAMEVFDELMESEVSIVVPHITEIVHFCLEVGLKSPIYHFVPTTGNIYFYRPY